MNNPVDTDYITIQRAADMLGVSTKTLRRWETHGVLVPIRTFGNQRRYLVADIHAFQKQQTPVVKVEEYASSYIETSDKILKNASFIPMMSKPQRFVIGLFILFFLLSLSAFSGSRFGKMSQKDQSYVLGLTDDQSDQSFFGDVPTGAVLSANDDSNDYVMKINIPAELYAGMTVDGNSIFNGDVEISGNLTAANLGGFLTGLTAGDGISIGVGERPLITNTGVLSFGGKTGAVELIAGTGITIDGTTISAQTPAAPVVTNSFATINIDGTSIVAGSATDILELVSGAGITITTSGNSITITNSMESPLLASSGGTGFETYTIGDMLYASSATELAKLAAGGAGQVLVMSGGVPVWGSMTGDVCTNCLVADPDVAQTVTPTADVTGFSVRGANAGTADIFTLKNFGGTETYFQMTAAGNIVLGNTTANTVSFVSRVNSNVEPSTGSQYDLGSSARRWKTIYADEANFTNFSTENASISGTTADDFLINSDYVGNDGESSSITFERGSPAVNAQLMWNTTDSQIPYHILMMNAPLFVNPDIDITGSGTAAFMVNQPFSEDIFAASASGVGKFVIKNNGDVGIGTTAPDARLHAVGGDTYVAPDSGYTFDNPSANEDMYVYGNLEVDGNTYLSTLFIGGTQVNATSAELNLLDGTTVVNGGVLFGDGTKIAQSVSNFFWDTTNVRLGIGTSAPAAGLQVVGTTEQLRLGYDASNYSSFIIGSDGTLTLSDTGNVIATFNEVNANFSVPTTFSAAGDVSVAYDMVFTNQNSSGIYSYGPLTIESGESFENNNLTLKTYGTGDLVADIGGNIIMQSADPAIVFDTSTATDTDFWMGITEDAGGDDDDLFQIGKGTTVGTTPYLTIDTYGRIGIGSTAPTSRLQVSNSGQTVLGKALVSFDQYENQPIFVASASGAPKFIVDYTGNVGIGSSLPTDKLDVQGGAKIGAGYAGMGTTAPANGLLVQGKVGIGTSSPAGKLQINQDGYTSANGIVLNTSDLGGGYTNAYIYTNSNDALTITQGSSVYLNSNGFGVGASPINYKFHVEANTTTNYAAGIINIGGTGSDGLLVQVGGATSTSQVLRLTSNNGATEVLTALGNGFVGIGITNPTDKLDVAGGVKIGAGYAGIGTTAPANGLLVQGNVGIGTSTPSEKLSIFGGNMVISAAEGTYRLRTTLDDNNGIEMYLYDSVGTVTTRISGDSSGTTYFSKGNVGIGTTAPTDKLDVAGGVKIGAGYAGMGTTAPANGLLVQGSVGIGTTAPGYKLQVQVDAATEGHVAADGTWANTSDVRLKTNVLTMEHGLGTILGLRPVTYNSTTDPTGEKTGLRMGFIAQEVETLLPHVVDTDPVTGYKSISYTRFIPYLTSAIQELSVAVDGLATTTSVQQESINQLDQTVVEAIVEKPLPYTEMIASMTVSLDTLASMSGFAASDSAEADPNFYADRSLASWLTDIIIEGYAVFKKTTVFLGSVAFRNQVQFIDTVFLKGTVEFNKNTAGVGIVSKFTDTVSVQFETPYKSAPIVSISLTDKTASESAMFLEEGKNAVVTDVNEKGFSIHLPQKAMRDYEYNWVAIYVKDPTVTKSSSDVSEMMMNELSDPSSTVSSTPTLVPSPTVSASSSAGL